MLARPFAVNRRRRAPQQHSGVVWRRLPPLSPAATATLGCPLGVCCPRNDPQKSSLREGQSPGRNNVAKKKRKKEAAKRDPLEWCTRLTVGPREAHCSGSGCRGSLIPLTTLVPPLPSTTSRHSRYPTGYLFLLASLDLSASFTTWKLSPLTLYFTAIMPFFRYIHLPRQLVAQRHSNRGTSTVQPALLLVASSDVALLYETP